MERVRQLLIVAIAVCVIASTASSAHAGQLQWRGVVEGFYGQAWSHHQRLTMLNFLAKYSFNAFIYAPKDDLYQRARWRVPYPRAELKLLTEEVKFARRRGIEWIPNISPAKPLLPSTARQVSAPLCFSCRSDLLLVATKLKTFERAGARTFMVSFDDVVPQLTYKRDVEKFGSGEAAFGAANADFLNRLQQMLPAAKLITVGAHYAGTASSAYPRSFGRRLANSVDVMWTGPAILSQPFTQREVKAYASLIGREPVLWDNWTSTDTTGLLNQTGSSRIFMGPYVREPSVAADLKGIFLNPMNAAVLNQLSLATAGTWMSSPTTYRPRAAWLRAVRQLADRRTERTLRAWAETSYATRLSEVNAPTFSRLSAHLLAAYGQSDQVWRESKSKLGIELELIAQAPASLKRWNPIFAREAEPFTAASMKAVRAARLAVELLDRKRTQGDTRQLRAELDAAVSEFERDPHFVFGWRGGRAQDLGAYPVPENALTTFIDHARKIAE